MLRHVRSILPAACLLTQGASLPLRALATQASLPSLASFGGLLSQQEGPSRLRLQRQDVREPLLLGQHALLPQVARAVAELQATNSLLVPDLDLGLHVGLTVEEPSPFTDPLGWLCHTKRTFNPSLIIRKRRHGFLSRLGKVGGRKVIARRKTKGRWRVTA